MINDLPIAIIGAGPSGLYAAEALLKQKPELKIFIFDALYCPYGLVRSGVAPDHYKIKEVIKLFDKTLAKEQITFLGNVHIGKDLTINEIREYFSAVIICTGAHKDRKLNIEGEDLTEVTNATNFVGWYNSHPWFQNFSIPFDKEKVYVIGQGNVAIDVSRILLKDPRKLETTDISQVVLEKLKSSKIKEVHLIGRRGPLEAAFTDKELKELGELDDVFVEVRKDDLILSNEEAQYLESAPKTLKSNFEILKQFSEKTYCGEKKRLKIRFFLSPLQFFSKNEDAPKNSLGSILLCKNRLEGQIGSKKAIATAEEFNEDVDIVLKSIGYKGENLENLPWDESRGTFIHEAGLIIDGSYQLYTSGWIKRGPSGVIGTNKADSFETVQTLINNFDKLPNPNKNLNEIYSLLLKKNIQPINFQDWKKLDNEEITRGKGIASRVKFNSNQEALSFLKLES